MGNAEGGCCGSEVHNGHELGLRQQQHNDVVSETPENTFVESAKKEELTHTRLGSDSKDFQKEKKIERIDDENYYEWANGNTYVGQVVDGKMEGRGTYTWKDGREYEGDWKLGKLDGVSPILTTERGVQLARRPLLHRGVQERAQARRGQVPPRGREHLLRAVEGGQDARQGHVYEQGGQEDLRGMAPRAPRKADCGRREGAD